MLNILFLTHRFPFPPDRGDRIRSHAWIRHLAGRGHRIALAALVDGPPGPAQLRAAHEVCATVDVGSVPRWRRLLAPGYLPTTAPLTLPLSFSPGLQARVDQRLRTGAFDVLFVYCSSMAPYVLSVPGVPKVIDFVDVDSQKWADYAALARLPMRAVYHREAAALRRYERRIALACAHALVASEREAEILRDIAPRARVTTVANGVDAPAPRPSPPATRKLVFTGVMDYWPNVDAVTFFARDILPVVRASVPDAELVVVGQRPSRDVRRLARLPGVTVTGWVSDVARHLAEAALFVAPLRLARGIQNKILEAMAAGVAVVATPVALAGLDAVPGRDVLSAETPGQFAGHVVALLDDAALRERLGRAGAGFVARHHRWPSKVEVVEEVLRGAAGARADAIA